MLSSVLYSLRLEGGGNVTKPPFLDLIVLFSLVLIIFGVLQPVGGAPQDT